jgi:hypothetical protein
MKHEISKDGDEFWYDDDWKFHREDGPAFSFTNIIDKTRKTHMWFKHGIYHRLDGPAIYSFFDNSHRLEGPIFEWWIEGTKINCKDNDEFLRIVKMRSLL